MHRRPNATVFMKGSTKVSPACRNLPSRPALWEITSPLGAATTKSEWDHSLSPQHETVAADAPTTIARRRRLA